MNLREGFCNFTSSFKTFKNSNLLLREFNRIFLRLSRCCLLFITVMFSKPSALFRFEYSAGSSIVSKKCGLFGLWGVSNCCKRTLKAFLIPQYQLIGFGYWNLLKFILVRFSKCLIFASVFSTNVQILGANIKGKPFYNG